MYITATQTADALAVAPSTPVARGAVVPGASFEITVKTQIRSNWLRPANTTDDLSCEVLVRLLPDGGIQSVRIARSSGNGAFDRSVEAAVLKSDPLPKPPGGLREITFVFNAT
jgi:colicin import membrane protein